MTDSGITFKRIDCIGIYKDGVLTAIEEQPNGCVIRHMTTVATKTDAISLFGIDRV